MPALRGKEKDRRPGDILAEIRALVAEGVSEVTLLGQNVNAYGVEFGDRQAFSKLLRACGDIEGLERVRFTCPHPAEFTDDVIEAMAETPNVMPSLHMPLQSGSDKVLKDMRRSYRQTKFLGIIDRVRAAIPDAAITTDIIVGFPGETEEDFAETLRRGRAPRASPAPSPSSTPSAPAPRPRRWRTRSRPTVVKDRYGRLVDAGQRDRLGGEQAAGRSHRRADGRRGRGAQGRRDATGSPAARPDNRLVHFAAARGASEVRPGDMVTVEVTYAAPHHLVADRVVSRAAYPLGRRVGGPHRRRPLRRRRPRHAHRRRPRPAARTPPPAADPPAGRRPVEEPGTSWARWPILAGWTRTTSPVAEVLTRLGGVATRAELVRACSRRAVDAALASGEVVVLARGRYALPLADAARAAAHRVSGVVSHRSAALLHGWAVHSPPRIPEVILPRNRRVSDAQREASRCTGCDLHASEVDAACTTRDRTLVDCLRTLPFVEALAIADSALREGSGVEALQTLVRDLRGPGSAAARPWRRRPPGRPPTPSSRRCGPSACRWRAWPCAPRSASGTRTGWAAPTWSTNG